MYQLDFTPIAEADLARLDAPVARRVFKKLRWLTENFDAVSPQALSARWQSVFKLRVGDYRVLYTFDRAKQRITIHFARHRDEIYQAE